MIMMTSEMARTRADTAIPIFSEVPIVISRIS
jgi:hypothetical protein